MLNSPDDLHQEVLALGAYFDSRGIQAHESLSIAGCYVSCVLDHFPPEAAERFKAAIERSNALRVEHVPGHGRQLLN